MLLIRTACSTFGQRSSLLFCGMQNGHEEVNPWVGPSFNVKKQHPLLEVCGKHLFRTRRRAESWEKGFWNRNKNTKCMVWRRILRIFAVMRRGFALSSNSMNRLWYYGRSKRGHRTICGARPTTCNVRPHRTVNKVVTRCVRSAAAIEGGLCGVRILLPSFPLHCACGQGMRSRLITKTVKLRITVRLSASVLQQFRERFVRDSGSLAESRRKFPSYTVAVFCYMHGRTNPSIKAIWYQLRLVGGGY